MELSMLAFRNLLKLAIEEDVGYADITTLGSVAADSTATARIIAKQDLVFCGGPLIQACFNEVGSPGDVELLFLMKEGQPCAAGTTLVRLKGRARTLLTGERLTLNFLQRLSGIATHVRSYTSRIMHTQTRLIDTRKTNPGWRSLEKYAVFIGGGGNHRHGLFDGVLLKENHIRAAGGITMAVRRVRAGIHHLVRIEVEVTSLEEVDEAVKAGAEGLLLDNMTPDQIKQALEVIPATVFTEASGGITLETIKDYAETGVDFLSVGNLTHGADWVDISMYVDTMV